MNSKLTDRPNAQILYHKKSPTHDFNYNESKCILGLPIPLSLNSGTAALSLCTLICDRKSLLPISYFCFLQFHTNLELTLQRLFVLTFTLTASLICLPHVVNKKTLRNGMLHRHFWSLVKWETKNLDMRQDVFPISRNLSRNYYVIFFCQIGSCAFYAALKVS